MDKVNHVSKSNDNLGAIYEAKLTLVQVPVLFYSFYRLAWYHENLSPTTYNVTWRNVNFNSFWLSIQFFVHKSIIK